MTAIYKLGYGLVLLLLGPLSLVTTGFAQNEQDYLLVLERVQVALSRGDARALTSMGSDPIEVSVPGSHGLLSNAQASHVLNAFFQRHPSRGFRFAQQMGNNNHGYAIGEYLDARENQLFQVTVHLRKQGKRIFVGSIQFRRK